MSKAVKGFLASDGKFFDTEHECHRHEYAQALLGLCDTHGINPDNFFALLREWKPQIEGYFNADSKCKVKACIATGSLAFASDLPYDQEDNEDVGIADKDAPAFLEQQVRRHK